MALDFEQIANIGIFVIFVIILGLFIWQVTLRKRSAKHLIASLTCGVIGSLLMVIDSRVIPGLVFERYLVLTLELAFFAFQIFFFYLFLENMNSIKLNPYRLTVALVLLVINLVALYLLYSRQVYLKEFGPGSEVDSKIGDVLWMIADIGYNASAIFAYGLCGIIIYTQTYRFTKERKPQVFIIALIFITLGFTFSLMMDLNSYSTNRMDIFDTLGDLSEYFKLLGLFMFMITYLTDINYLYRLPFNIYMLNVLCKNGNTVHTIHLKTENKVFIQEHMLSGLISAINMVFSETLKTKSMIETIASKEATIMLKTGEFITAIIVTDRASAVLSNALNRYLIEFERKFSEQLKAQNSNMEDFDSAKELIRSIFPFFQIEESR